MDFADNEIDVYDEIWDILKKYSNFKRYEVKQEAILSPPGLEIYPERRKIYRDQQEIYLTAKEYDILCLLVKNKGKVLTYQQIYETVWGDISTGNEKAAIGYHICNLREKLYGASPNVPFKIRCVREIGYSFEVNNNVSI